MKRIRNLEGDGVNLERAVEAAEDHAVFWQLVLPPHLGSAARARGKVPLREVSKLGCHRVRQITPCALASAPSFQKQTPTCKVYRTPPTHTHTPGISTIFSEKSPPSARFAALREADTSSGGATVASAT